MTNLFTVCRIRPELFGGIFRSSLRVFKRNYDFRFFFVVSGSALELLSTKSNES